MASYNSPCNSDIEELVFRGRDQKQCQSKFALNRSIRSFLASNPTPGTSGILTRPSMTGVWSAKASEWLKDLWIRLISPQAEACCNVERELMSPVGYDLIYGPAKFRATSIMRRYSTSP